MKRCRVKIDKQFSKNGKECKNVYPAEYDPELMEVLCYEDRDSDHDGVMESYLVCMVPDDFDFTPEMMEISKADFDQAIELHALSARHKVERRLAENPELANRFPTPDEVADKFRNRKSMADDMVSKAETKAERKAKYKKDK